jgi:hypothetical protein
MAIDIVARALAVSGKQNLSNYYTKTESDERYALINGDANKKFKVADPIDDTDAVNKKTLESLIGKVFSVTIYEAGD